METRFFQRIFLLFKKKSSFPRDSSFSKNFSTFSKNPYSFQSLYFQSFFNFKDFSYFSLVFPCPALKKKEEIRKKEERKEKKKKECTFRLPVYLLAIGKKPLGYAEPYFRLPFFFFHRFSKFSEFIEQNTSENREFPPFQS